MSKRNVKPYTGVWKGKKQSFQYTGWCDILEISPGSFYVIIKKYESFQDFIDAYLPDHWKELDYFLYRKNNDLDVKLI